MLHRFGPNGLYVLDEPEGALSLNGILALMRRMHDLVREGSQFIISTHSPILLGYPNARIYVLSDDGINQTEYEDTDQYRRTLVSRGPRKGSSGICWLRTEARELTLKWCP